MLVWNVYYDEYNEVYERKKKTKITARVIQNGIEHMPLFDLFLSLFSELVVEKHKLKPNMANALNHMFYFWMHNFVKSCALHALFRYGRYEVFVQLLKYIFKFTASIEIVYFIFYFDFCTFTFIYLFMKLNEYFP